MLGVCLAFVFLINPSLQPGHSVRGQQLPELTHVASCDRLAARVAHVKTPSGADAIEIVRPEPPGFDLGAYQKSEGGPLPP